LNDSHKGSRNGSPESEEDQESSSGRNNVGEASRKPMRDQGSSGHNAQKQEAHPGWALRKC